MEQELLEKINREIKAIDLVNKELKDEIEAFELSIKKKELILQKLELEELLKNQKN